MIDQRHQQDPLPCEKCLPDDTLNDKSTIVVRTRPDETATLTVEDDIGDTIFTFPQTSLIDDLLDSIRYKEDAESFLNDFLKEEL